MFEKLFPRKALFFEISVFRYLVFQRKSNKKSLIFFVFSAVTVFSLTFPNFRTIPSWDFLNCMIRA